MSLVTTLKELYYAGHQPGEVNSTGSTRFVLIMREAVLDGKSYIAREPDPSITVYSQSHAKILYWRTLLFGDPIALACLRENITTFYQHLGGPNNGN